MNDSVRVRLAGREEAPAITSVINAAFRVAEGFFIVADRIDLKGVLALLEVGVFLLAERDSLVLGCVYVEFQVNSSERAYLGLLSVAPAHQQSGLGSQLMDAAEEYGRDRGARFMDIKVVNLREELFAYYRHRGYVETGVSAFPEDIETTLACHFIDMSKALT